MRTGASNQIKFDRNLIIHGRDTEIKLFSKWWPFNKVKSSFHLSIIFDSPTTQDTTMESPTVKRVEDLIYRIGRVSYS